jgi:hypothetical protein
MVYIFLAVAFALAFASYVKVVELEKRIKEIERKIKWWF